MRVADNARECPGYLAALVAMMIPVHGVCGNRRAPLCLNELETAWPRLHESPSSVACSGFWGIRHKSHGDVMRDASRIALGGCSTGASAVTAS